MGRLAGRLGRQEDGFVVVLAVALLAVMGTLAALVLATGVHADFATGRGRAWVQALHVAEAGVENAIVRLEDDDAFLDDAVGATASLTGSMAEGTYTLALERLSRGRIEVVSTGDAGTGRGLTASRKLEVILGPPREFTFALFSLTDIDTKNNDQIVGDIWANQSVIVDNNDTVEGSVTAATGYVKLKQGSRVTGDVTSGDYNPDDSNRAIHLENGATIEGDATAATTDSDCPLTPADAYDVHLAAADSTIGGALKTCGEKTGNGPQPSPYSPDTYTSAPGTLEIPEFTYDADNYDGEVEYTGAGAVANFNASLGATLSGVYYIDDSDAVNQSNRVELRNLTITGDLVIVSNAPIFTDNVEANTADARIILVSTYQPPADTSCDVNQDSSECAIHVKNNFDLNGDGTCNSADDPAVLIYSKYGPTAIKNNETQCGVVYAQNIQIKNNQTFTYDPRVDRTIGFGPVTYEITSWKELAP